MRCGENVPLPELSNGSRLVGAAVASPFFTFYCCESLLPAKSAAMSVKMFLLIDSDLVRARVLKCMGIFS